MTNSDGGFQFDFQHPEEPSKPTVPPLTAPTAAQPTQPVPNADTAATQAFQPMQPTQPTQAVPSYDATAATQAFQPTQFEQPTVPAYGAGIAPEQTTAMPAAQAIPAVPLQPRCSGRLTYRLRLPHNRPRCRLPFRRLISLPTWKRSPKIEDLIIKATATGTPAKSLALSLP